MPTSGDSGHYGGTFDPEPEGQVSLDVTAGLQHGYPFFGKDLAILQAYQDGRMVGGRLVGAVYSDYAGRTALANRALDDPDPVSAEQAESQGGPIGTAVGPTATAALPQGFDVQFDFALPATIISTPLGPASVLSGLTLSMPNVTSIPNAFSPVDPNTGLPGVPAPSTNFGTRGGGEDPDGPGGATPGPADAPSNDDAGQAP